MKAYSEDLPKRIVEAVSRGMGTSEAARTFGVSLSSKSSATSAWHTREVSRSEEARPGLRPKIDEQSKRLLQANLLLEVRPLPFRNGESSCGELRGCGSATRRSPG